jgi:hypothetical protein
VNHLLAGTTHLEVKKCLHKIEVLKREKDGMIQRVKFCQHPIGTTDTGSVLPMGADPGRKPLNPGDLSNQKI